MQESRLFKILYYLLEKGRTTAPELAKRFEVSVRTIYRDMDALSEAGIPIYAEPGRNGGICLLDGFVLDKTVLSDKEYYATELMDQIYGDGSQSKLFLNAREKKSLCYFCASSYDEVNGVIVVGCGIDNADVDAAKNEILFQLEELRNGNITDEEIRFAKESPAGLKFICFQKWYSKHSLEPSKHLSQSSTKSIYSSSDTGGAQ